MQIHEHYFREPQYRKTVLKELTKIFFPNSNVTLISLANSTIPKG